MALELPLFEPFPSLPSLPDVGKLVLFSDDQELGEMRVERPESGQKCRGRQVTKIEKIEKGKRGHDGSPGRPGRPGRPGPATETLAFGAQSLVGDGTLIPFFLVASGNLLNGLPLDASALTNLTPGYAGVALTSTNKMNLGVSIDGDATPATVTITVTVSSPNLPIANAFQISRLAAKPFGFFQNIDFNVAAGNIVYVSVDPGAVAPSIVTGVDVTVDRYIG